jgi:hypothetical protein
MKAQHNLPPSAEQEELDPATAEAIQRAQLVKFVPTYFHEAGRPKDAGEAHVAVLCRTPGDTLTFGITPLEAGNRNPSWMDLGTGGVGAVWVVTSSGNRYGIGNGIAYNHNAGGAYALDPNVDQLQLRVGQEAVIPGAGTTGTVKSILINDEMNYGDSPYSWTGKDASTARIVNEPVDPLLDIRPIGDAVRNGDDATSAITVLRDDVLQLKGNASFI